MDDAATPDALDLGPVDAPATGPRRVRIGDTSVVVARCGDRVLAAVDRCPHRGAPLSAGSVEDDCLVCPYHGWRFDADGEIADIPALGPDARLPRRARLRTVATTESDGRVLVDPAALPESPVPPTAVANDDEALRAGWHPVCRSEEVAPGDELTVALLGQRWTVHRGGDGVLSCPGAHDVADHLGHVWITPDEPVAPLLEVPELDGPGWHHVPMPRVEGRYGVALLLDNQLDAGHFSFVHRDTFGNPAGAALPPYDVERDGAGFEAVLRVPISARNDVTDAAGTRPEQQHRTMTYRYRAPSTLFLRLDYEEMGGSTGILFCFTPLDRDTARMDVDLYLTHPDGFTDEQLAARLDFEIRVVAEDLALQDRFEFLEMPLDLTAEIHTRADKSAVEMRRILAGLYRSEGSAMPMRDSTEVSTA